MKILYILKLVPKRFGLILYNNYEIDLIVNITNIQEVCAQNRFRDVVEESKDISLKKFISVDSILAVQQELGSWCADRLLGFLLESSGNNPCAIELNVIKCAVIKVGNCILFVNSSQI